MDAPTLHIVDHAQQPVRKAIRRLRWFRESFAEQVAQVSAETGIAFEVNDRALTAAFVEWLRGFEAQKPSDPAERRAYVGFAAGLMLQTLIAFRPLSVMARPGDADETNPAYFWPEGYVYVAFCLNIRAAVLEQDFDEHRRETPQMSELRNWWSFRENAAQDPALGVAFLDLFAGEDPNWTAPGVFAGGDPVSRIATRFYERKRLTD